MDSPPYALLKLESDHFSHENSCLPKATGIAKKYNSLKGVTLIDGMSLLKGFCTFIHQGSIQELQERICQGIPPIVIFAWS
jgi:hypothetical protein